MNGKEHNPPHVHVFYAEYAAIIEIETLEVLDGKLPNKALELAKEWIKIHKSEILEMWNSQNFKRIMPLK